MRRAKIEALGLAVGVFFACFVLGASANAGSMRNGSVGQGANVTGARPGPVLWAHYDTTHSFAPCPSGSPGGCNVGGNGDNIIRLINPNGSANPNIAGGSEQFVCAMIYVFDDAQEMGECGGCPISSADMATLSVLNDLTSNFGLGGNPDGNTRGVIAIVAAAPNGTDDQGHPTCDATNSPGYSVNAGSNLLGSIVHNQTVTTETGLRSGLTETPLFDDASGDQTNLTYLQEQCGTLVGNGTGGGQVFCTTDGVESWITVKIDDKDPQEFNFPSENEVDKTAVFRSKTATDHVTITITNDGGRGGPTTNFTFTSLTAPFSVSAEVKGDSVLGKNKEYSAGDVVSLDGGATLTITITFTPGIFPPNTKFTIEDTYRKSKVVVTLDP